MPCRLYGPVSVSYHDSALRREQIGMTAETREWKTLRASERDTYPVKILESEITRIGFLDKSYNGVPQRGRKQIVHRLIECMDTGFRNPALISSNVKTKSACVFSTRWLLAYQQPSQPAQKGNPRPAGSRDLQRQVSPTTAGEVFGRRVCILGIRND